MAEDLIRMPSATEGRTALASMSLQPKSMDEAMAMAKLLSQSELVPAALKNKPADCLLVGLMGRDHGLSFTQAFSCIHVIAGKPVMSAQLLLALVKKAPECKYFRLVKSDATGATWETLREGSPEPEAATFTADDAKALGLHTKDNYLKQKATMFEWRAAAKLARRTYPDRVLGIYIEEEAEEIQRSTFTPPVATANPAEGLIPLGPVAEPEPKRRGRPRKEVAVGAEVVAEPAASTQMEPTPFDPPEMTPAQRYAELTDDAKIAHWTTCFEACETVEDLKEVAESMAELEPKGTEVRKHLQEPYKATKARVA